MSGVRGITVTFKLQRPNGPEFGFSYPHQASHLVIPAMARDFPEDFKALDSLPASSDVFCLLHLTQPAYVCFSCSLLLRELVLAVPYTYHILSSSIHCIASHPLWPLLICHPLALLGALMNGLGQLSGPEKATG